MRMKRRFSYKNSALLRGKIIKKYILETDLHVYIKYIGKQGIFIGVA